MLTTQISALAGFVGVGNDFRAIGVTPGCLPSPEVLVTPAGSALVGTLSLKGEIAA